MRIEIIRFNKVFKLNLCFQHAQRDSSKKYLRKFQYFDIE